MSHIRNNIFYNYELFCKSNIPKTDWSIVLDLDETLVHTIVSENLDLVNGPKCKSLEFAHDLGIYNDPKLFDIKQRAYHFILHDVMGKKGSGSKHGCWGITRPYLDDFLAFCFKYFKTVNVWSAGKYDYVHEICKYISMDFPEFDYIYTYNDCQKDNNCKYKDLRAMLDECPNIGPIEKVFIIDDRDTTFSMNHHNGIKIPIFGPCSQIDTNFSVDKNHCIQELRMEDDHLLTLKDWFLLPEVVTAHSVEILDKNNIF